MEYRFTRRTEKILPPQPAKKTGHSAGFCVLGWRIILFPTAKVLTINGNAIHDIPSFYDGINCVFMGDEDWKIGQSRDALDDLFHSGFGTVEGNENFILIWQNMEKSRVDLGLETPYSLYEAKLD